MAEVVASSMIYDLNEKRSGYEQNGVQEYLVWQTEHERIDWWELHEGVYVPLPADEQGIIRSRVFPGLWLHVPALLADDLVRVMATLQQGIASPEHAAFVEAISRSAEE